jgi:hypothetical protein
MYVVQVFPVYLGYVEITPYPDCVFVITWSQPDISLIKNTFDSEEAEELKSTAEIIWEKLTLPSGSKLYIGSRAGFILKIQCIL